MKITNFDTVESILHSYRLYSGTDGEFLKEDPNPFKDKIYAEDLCRFLKRYFYMDVPQREIALCGTVADVHITLEAFLPKNRTALFYRLMTFYRDRVTWVWNELKTVRTDQLNLAQRLRQEAEQIDNFVCLIDEIDVDIDEDYYFDEYDDEDVPSND